MVIDTSDLSIDATLETVLGQARRIWPEGAP
jgi:hypothetical protein